MSLEHMDNWQTYGIGGEAHLYDGIYAAGNGNIVADPDPSGTGLPVLSLSGNTNKSIRYILNAQVATFGMAQRIYMPALPGPFPRFQRFYNAGGQQLGYFQIIATGQIQYVNNTGTILGTSDLAWKLTANAWHHVETKTLFNNAAGTVEVRVNGIVAMTLAGVNTVGANAGPLAIVEMWGGPGDTTGMTIYYKDIVMWNSLGAHNNDFFGTVQVISMVPNSDVTLGAWVPSTGAVGWSILDNAPPNDAQYIDAAYPGAVNVPSQFGLTDLPIDVTSVRALQSLTRATKTDGGDGNLQTSLVSGASTGAGVDRPITAAFTYWKDIFELDPATAAPWTIAAANAVQLKINRTV